MSSTTRTLLLDHARKVSTHEGWFPEFDFNGRMKRPLDTLVSLSLLECRKVNRRGIEGHDSWPTHWYRVPRVTGVAADLPRSA